MHTHTKCKAVTVRAATAARWRQHRRRVFDMHVQELTEQKDELMSKVQALKTDLQDWRTKLEAQVKSYKSVRCTTEAEPQYGQAAVIAVYINMQVD